MPRVMILVALSGCSSPSLLTGDAIEDFATLSASVEVDCADEPLCGPVPRCLRSALHDDQIGVIHDTAWTYIPATGQIETYPRHLFTYEGAVIQIDDMRSTTANPGLYELRCPRLIVATVDPDCWKWIGLECAPL